MKMLDYYFGQIQEVYPPSGPNSEKNISKYQYEYQVIVTGEDYASIPTRCIRKDAFGSGDDFDDMVMQPGDKVMVEFPRGDRSVGIIQHGTRNYVAPQNVLLGRHWRTRFNQIVKYIDKNGNYSVTSDQGPNLQVNVSTIVLDDSVGDNITIDKNAKTITINCNTWDVNVSGNANLNISGDVNVKATNATVIASQTATVDGTSVNLGANATDAVIKGNTFKTYFDQHIHPTPVGPSGAPSQPMPPNSLSQKVETQ